jgi:transcription elongation factor Elf1
MVDRDGEEERGPQVGPPRCPKCGSHRTQIIGMSQDRKPTFLRCGGCGARSEVPVRDADLGA